MLYDKALSVAQHIRESLLPGCEQLVIAGSLRRQKPDVKDIELVAELKPGGLFGDIPDTGALEAAIASAMRDGVIAWDLELRRNGDKYKRFIVPQHGICVDFFVADHDNFGNILAIRTGNSEFSRLLVTKQSQGGLMPDDMRQGDGFLFLDGKRLSCSTEEDFFAAIRVPMIEPQDRNADAVMRVRREIGI